MPPLDPVAELLARETFGIKFGLENIRALLAGLHHPESAYRSAIVAGTNGKGSVAAMVAAALTAAGHRTGRYTSPHLVRIEERFAIDGRAVATEALRAAAATVLAAEARALAASALLAPTTFFELTTAAAFELFRRGRIDVAVLEVGMGGRFDATNAASPVAGAITTIDLDHTRYLGETLEAIAFEKAGIIDAAMTVVTGERKPGPAAVVERAARERGATLVPAFEGVRAEVSLEDGVTHLSLATPTRDYGTLPLSLRGRHQADNAVVATRLLEALDVAGVAVPAGAIHRGLIDGSVRPGRLDLVARADGRRVLFDAAHNPAGAATLAAYLHEVWPARVPLVFGAMRDKDVSSMLRVLAPTVSRVFCTAPAMARAWPADELAAHARALGLGLAIDAEEDPARALDRALDAAPVACVAGSMFLVGALLPGASADATA